MTARAAAARKLATLLSRDSGEHVTVCYERDHRRYRVDWHGDTTAEQMRHYVHQHAEVIEPRGLGLDLLTLRT